MHTKILGVGADPQWFWVRGRFDDDLLPANIGLVDHWLAGCLSAPANDGFRSGKRNTRDDALEVDVTADETHSAVREAFDHLFESRRGQKLTLHLRGLNAVTGEITGAGDGSVFVAQGDGGIHTQFAYANIDNVTVEGAPVANP